MTAAVDAAPALAVDAAWTSGRFSLDVRFTVDEPVAALVGPSGAGKTTVLDLVAGLRRPGRGRIAVAGRVLFDSEAGVNLRPEARRVGYVFQDVRLFPHLDVARNLDYGLQRCPPARRRIERSAVVALLELGPLLGRRPDGLSGGEGRRVALGRALLTSPDLLLMDEPMTGLDSGLKDQILPFLKRVPRELSVPMLYVTHHAAELEALGAQAIAIDGGRLV